MDYLLLGPLSVRDGEREVALPAGKPRAVLALLLLRAGEVVPADAIVDALWDGRPSATADNALQGYVGQLRRVLGRDAIETRPPGYVLRLRDGDTLDLVELAELVETRDDPERLRAALGLFRGPVLPELRYEAWAQAELGRIEELRLGVLEDRIDAELAAARHAELVGELDALVGEHPLRERLRAQLMLALYRSGRQAEALAAYADARAALVDGLGIDPGPDLQALHVAVLNQDSALGVERRPAPTVRLPVAPTRLVGRDDDRRRLVDLLTRERERLVTITGPGGMGKTRLATDVAGAVADSFADGVWFVELAALRDPALVVSAIATTIGAPGDLAAHVGDGRLLLVLDNFEQVVDAAPALAQLLVDCPRLALLVTSREHLRLRAEVEHELAPLRPADAVRLFRDRAQALGTELGAESDEVAELCRRLDGLPLAIELAAARTRLFGPAELIERLGAQLALLTGGPRDAPERHRTLATTIDWSHQLLGEEERRLFAGLGVFGGRFSLADVEAVLSSDLETLASLIDKSLVVRQADESGRFRLLASVREFALGRLAERGDAELVRQRHARFVLDEITRADDLLTGPEQSAAFETIARRHDDLRAALDWASLRDDGELALQLVCAAGWFWYIRGHLAEGRARLESALALAGAEPTATRGCACMRAGAIADAQNDLVATERFYREAYEIRRGLGDRPGTAGALNNLGTLALHAGDYPAARSSYDESLALARAIEDAGGIAAALLNLALVDLAEDEPASAAARLDEALALATEIGNHYGAAHVRNALGVAMLELGEHARAAAHLAESVRLRRELDEPYGIAASLDALAALAIATGDAGAAARRLGAAAAVRAAVGSERGRDDADRAARTEARAREQLDGGFDEAWELGRRLSLERAVDLAEREAGDAASQGAPALD